MNRIISGFLFGLFFLIALNCIAEEKKMKVIWENGEVKSVIPIEENNKNKTEEIVVDLPDKLFEVTGFPNLSTLITVLKEAKKFQFSTYAKITGFFPPLKIESGKKWIIIKDGNKIFLAKEQIKEVPKNIHKQVVLYALFLWLSCIFSYFSGLYRYIKGKNKITSIFYLCSISITIICLFFCFIHFNWLPLMILIITFLSLVVGCLNVNSIIEGIFIGLLFAICTILFLLMYININIGLFYFFSFFAFGYITANACNYIVKKLKY